MATLNSRSDESTFKIFNFCFLKYCKICLFELIFAKSHVKQFLPKCFENSFLYIFSKFFKKFLQHFSHFTKVSKKTFPKFSGILMYNNCFPTVFSFITRLRSRRVVICLVVVFVRSFVPSLIESRLFNIF